MDWDKPISIWIDGIHVKYLKGGHFSEPSVKRRWSWARFFPTSVAALGLVTAWILTTSKLMNFTEAGPLSNNESAIRLVQRTAHLVHLSAHTVDIFVGLGGCLILAFLSIMSVFWKIHVIRWWISLDEIVGVNNLDAIEKLRGQRKSAVVYLQQPGTETIRVPPRPDFFRRSMLEPSRISRRTCDRELSGS